MNIATMTVFERMALVKELKEADQFEELHQASTNLEKELLTTALIQLSEIEVRTA